jgi:hypothetical protein
MSAIEISEEPLRTVVRNLQYLQAAGKLDGIAEIINAAALRASGRLDDGYGPRWLIERAADALAPGSRRHDPSSLAHAAAMLAENITRYRADVRT